MSRSGGRFPAALIWDLDGTLIDSYAVSIPCLAAALQEFGLPAEEDALRRKVLTTSVRRIFEELQAQGCPAQDIEHRYDALVSARNSEVRACPYARLVLGDLAGARVSNFVFTHHDRFALSLLTQAGLSPWIQEIVDSQYGFPRKPSPIGICYLMDHHHLPRDSTFYVGDRSLDIQCAVAAGIGGILYLPEGSPVEPTGQEALVIHDLRALTDPHTWESLLPLEG